jgi:hypothetical protein
MPWPWHPEHFFNGLLGPAWETGAVDEAGAGEGQDDDL